MSVNHNILDEQHKKLFEKLNELLRAIVDGNADNMVQELVDFFENYMNKHLAYEEEYLKDIGYPYLQEHHEQHEIFVEIEFIDELKSVMTEIQHLEIDVIVHVSENLGMWHAVV